MKTDLTSNHLRIPGNLYAVVYTALSIHMFCGGHSTRQGRGGGHRALLTARTHGPCEAGPPPARGSSREERRPALLCPERGGPGRSGPSLAALRLTGPHRARRCGPLSWPASLASAKGTYNRRVGESRTRQNEGGVLSANGLLGFQRVSRYPHFMFARTRGCRCIGEVWLVRASAQGNEAGF